MKTFEKMTESAFAEADGLEALSEWVKTPKVFEVSDKRLITEWIEMGTQTAESASQLAQALVDLHSCRHEEFGWNADNWIGLSPQKNGWRSSWSDFFLENRLDFQFALSGAASIAGHFQKRREKIREILEMVNEAPSLCHGDLWSGNLLFDKTGNPVFIDPAVYYGHRETDLAMMKLFGGFEESVFLRYRELWPLADGAKEREKIYQLYHVVNHLNIFGSSYQAQAIRLLDSV